MLQDMETIFVLQVNQENQEAAKFHQDQHQFFVAFSQFQEYRRNNIAVNHDLRRIIKQTISSLKYNVTKMKDLRSMSRSFLSWKRQTQASKVKAHLVLAKVFSRLRQNRERKLKKNMRTIMNMTAENCYERCLKVKLFYEWKRAIEIGNKQKRVDEARKRRVLNQLIERIEQRKQTKFIRELSMSLFKQKIKKKSFRGWEEWAKMRKVTQIRMGKQKKRLIQSLRKNIKLEKQETLRKYEQMLVKSCFYKLEQNKKNQKCEKWRKKKVLYRFFRSWLSGINLLYYEKEEEVKKEEILSCYLERKSKVQLLYCFQLWANSTKASKDNKNQNQIAKQYAFYREKQYLLRKYFGAFKQYRYYERADEFYQRRLKQKTIINLKENLLRMSQKWQRLYQFVENREKRKYFISIAKFIDEQNEKVRKFRIKGVWNKFTFGLAKGHVQSNKKADSYYQTSLKYKSVFALKEMVVFKKKSNLTIIFINVNLNLKRWRKGFQIRSFYQNRIYMTKMKIFRQLKLIRMSKVWLSSQRYNEQETQRKKGLFHQLSHFTETSIQIENLHLESPSKLFSLEYSVSGYNSNNPHNNF